MKKLTSKTFQFFWRETRRYPFAFSFAILGVVVGVLSGLGMVLITAQIIDLMADSESFSVIKPKFFILGILTFFNHFGWRFGMYSLISLQPKVMRNVSNICFEKVHQHSYRFFTNNFVGSLVKQVNRMVRAYETISDKLMIDFLQLSVRITGSLIILYTVNAWIALGLLTWFVLFFTANIWASLYKLRTHDRWLARAESDFTGQLADSISNSITIKLFSGFNKEKQSFANVAENVKRRMTGSWLFSQHMELFQSIIAFVLEFSFVVLGVYFWSQGSLSLGDFVLIQTYSVTILVFTWDIGRALRDVYRAFADAEEMTLILNKKPEVNDKRGAKALHVRRGKVEFKKVVFSYEGEEMCRNVSFALKPGERVALVGPSGAGKSTIVKLLLRFFDLNKGGILIDGQDIAEVTQESLRAHIALVPQDPVLFHRTLMENIRYGRLGASDEEVIAAAKMAHCHEFISRMPKAYDTFVGERGVKLSGGERQRVAIARAILSNAPILVLDEATSNLDVQSEEYIQDALAKLMDNKTTIVIAHRLSTIVNMDRIIVLNEGRVEQEGSHKELLRKGGLYAELWQLFQKGAA